MHLIYDNFFFQVFYFMLLLIQLLIIRSTIKIRKK
jgi:hypothetical protein